MPDQPEWIVHIEDVVYRGRGLARHEGCVVFVPGVLPNETARVRVVSRRKHYAEAELQEIIEPSPHRTTPVCPLFEQPAVSPDAPILPCPGCRYQHMAYAEELRLKQGQLLTLLDRLGGGRPEDCPDPTPSPDVLGYRNKIQLHAQIAGGATRLGYVADDNRTVIDVERCPLAQEAINRELTARRDDPAFLSDLRSDERVTIRSHGPDRAVWWTGRRGTAPAELHETTPLGILTVPTRSFFQVNARVAGLVLDHVGALVAETGMNIAVDLYCGVGVFALAAAAANVTHVLGVDADSRAIQAARTNAETLGLHAEFAAGPAEDLVDRALGAVDPARTTLILDPPRRGLDPRVSEAIVRLRPAHVAYVSCAADTLARDVARLRAGGYELREARLFDMFPRTFSFETVAHLALSSPSA